MRADGMGMSYLNMISKEDISKIHEKSLYLLETVGVKVSHKKALDLLAKNGALVDFKSELVKLPHDLVEKCIKSAPKSLTLAARDPNHDLLLPTSLGEFVTACATGARDFFDPKEYRPRPAKKSDIKSYVRVFDALDNLDICASPSPQDVPPGSSDVHAVQTMFENTAKHICIQPYSTESLKYLINLGTTVAGGEDNLRKRPIMSLIACALSPLTYKSMDIEVMLQAGKCGIPIQMVSLVSAGTTAPVTIAGTVLQCNAELLASLTITQVLNPETPVIYCPIQFTSDMRTGASLQANVETVLAVTANVQLAKEMYKIPCRAYGLNCDSFIPDGQAMIERSFGVPHTALAGADIVVGAGELECIVATSISQLVIDNEILGMMRRVVRGIEVNDETLAVDVISQVGPSGNFIAQEHTARHCREFHKPRIFSPHVRNEWESAGSKDMYAQVNERLDVIIKEHQPLPLPKEIKKETRAIVAEADRELANS